MISRVVTLLTYSDSSPFRSLSVFPVHVVALLSSVAIIYCAPAFGDDNGAWIELFNGKNLDGWEQKGGTARYDVVDGMIVGTSVPHTSNSFLCTTREFDNFELQFEYLLDPELNSGVQIRSQSLPDYRDGRVHGYQCELENFDRNRFWTAGIYDESRRGWLYPHKDEKTLQAAFARQGLRITQRNDWNHIRIVASGDRILTFLNGEPRADLRDDMTPKGIIALQVHGVGDRQEPMTVKWRNLRLREISAP